MDLGEKSLLVTDNRIPDPEPMMYLADAMENNDGKVGQVNMQLSWCCQNRLMVMTPKGMMMFLAVSMT